MVASIKKKQLQRSKSDESKQKTTDEQIIGEDL